MFSVDGILGRNFAINTAALDGLAMRQQVHSENLANVDTEGYRSRTVNFERVLGAALQGESPGVRFNNPLGASAAVGDARTGGSLSSNFAIEQTDGEAGVDRTTEVSEMMNDNVKFRVVTQTVTNQLSAVRSVIAEMGRG